MAKRTTIGERLYHARERAGLSVPQLVQRIREVHGRDVGASTVRDIENDKTPNPGIKTVEAMSLGVQLDVLETISLALDNSPEFEKGFKASQFGRLWNGYSKLNKERRTFADEYIQMLIDRIARWSSG